MISDVEESIGREMIVEEVDTLVVGAGQAGIALSEHLSNNKIPHVILEKNRIAESWRSGRWDSLVANGPAWHDRFPNLEFSDTCPDGFPPKEEVADYLNQYADMINAPVKTKVEVFSAERISRNAHYLIKTSIGAFKARNVVSATGAFQYPSIPPIVPQIDTLTQLHSFHYRNPEQLPEGGVLVVGSGSSGAQIAEELNLAGRNVYLSIGPHERPPRAYRGRDFVWWT